MALFQMKGSVLRQLKERRFKLEKDLHILTEQNIEEILGLQFICGKLNKQLAIQSFVIDTLAFDPELKSFVILEYKKERHFSVIDQGFNYLALMLNNKAEFIIEYNERLESNLKRGDVNWPQSRVIFVAPSFTPHQRGSLAFKDLPIELWEVSLYEEGLLLYNQLRSSGSAESIQRISKKSKTISEVSKAVRTYDVNDHLVKASKKTRETFEGLRQVIMAIDNRIEEKPVSWYVGYKIGSRVFTSIQIYKNKLRVSIRGDRINDPRKRFRKIPPEWKWGKTPIWYSDITSEQEIDYILNIINEAVNKAYSL